MEGIGAFTVDSTLEEGLIYLEGIGVSTLDSTLEEGLIYLEGIGVSALDSTLESGGVAFTEIQLFDNKVYRFRKVNNYERSLIILLFQQPDCLKQNF